MQAQGNSRMLRSVQTATFQRGSIVGYGIRQLALIFGLALCAMPGLAAAQADDEFPSTAASTETLRVQEKVESLFDKGDFKRAYFIYLNELAPIGDKYAQYMLGYMHLTGKGTTEDRVAAAAWYRLAAERGTREFVRVRNQLMVSLTPDQVGECDRLFVQLRQQHGDLAILLRAVREDLEILRDRTGSRLGSRTSAVTVIDMRHGGTMGSGDEYYRMVEERLEARLRYIGAKLGIEAGNHYDIDIDEIEAKVAERLAMPD